MLRKRRIVVGFAALAVWLVALIFAVMSNVETDISPQGEASADVTLGNLRYKRTLSQTFPFFKMVCEEVEDTEAEP